MIKTITIIAIIIISIIILWSIWGYYASNVEQAEYTVIRKTKDYEIREYAPHIIAEVTLQGDYDNVTTQGFGIIAKYIFGNNKDNTSIAMTAPVMVRNDFKNENNKSNTISFFMPKSYNINNLPKPNNDLIKIIPVPAKKYLVTSFRWYRTENKIKKEQENLQFLANRDNLQIDKDFIYAGYNAPWTPPWMSRNEILVELK